MTIHFKRLQATLAVAVGLAMMCAVPAEAARAGKQKKRVAAPASQSVKSSRRTQGRYWGQNQVQAGPLYNGPDYLGDDPDPNIRFQILRDLDARYGGGD
jgi:hypothetical protein